MRPQPLTLAVQGSRALATQVLIAVDDSAHADRALRYVGTMLRTVPHAHILLFHVLRPMPREFLEHGGSEDPVVESRLGAELQKEQEEWVKAESELERPILANAQELLRKTGFPLDRVTLKFGHDDNIAQDILDEARQGGYGTIVVGRPVSTGPTHHFGGGVIEQLLRNATGHTVWIVD